VASLLNVNQKDPSVNRCGALIQSAFLLGWAVGGGFFGRLGDRLGRSRALVLTILTYALFTGASFFATAGWHLLIYRFLAALGIGGEWAVGASLLSETWPHRWRPWVAAVLQSNVNIGILLASLAYFILSQLGAPDHYVFLVGILPALLVLWIRRAVPETEEWHQARSQTNQAMPGIADLFRGEIRRTTCLTLLVCAFSLTAHWAFVFWSLQHLRRLPDVQSWTTAEVDHFISLAMAVNMLCSILGNFLAAAVARVLGYRRTIVVLCVIYGLTLFGAYGWPHVYWAQVLWIGALGACSGLFALFTMYLPPLFPTLLRTTGAGFCYNIGRVAAAAGTLLFGLSLQITDFRVALTAAGFLFLPAAFFAHFLPDLTHDGDSPRVIDTRARHMGA
jgi:MFS family permease